MKKFKIKKGLTKGEITIFNIGRFFNISLCHRAVIVNLNDEWDGKKIMIGNHSGAKGASVYRLSSPNDHYFMSWGAHQMIEGYKSRWHYLNDIFYGQKLGYSKFRAFISATLFALVSKFIYHIAGILPIYYDFRFKNTINYSFKCYENDINVLIFPEDSSKGYFDDLTKLLPGFLILSKLYYKKYHVDLPIYPLHFNRHYMQIVVGKPMYLQELLKKYTEEEILDLFLYQMNSLNHKYIIRDQQLDDGDLSLEEYDERKNKALKQMNKIDQKHINKISKKQNKNEGE